LKTILSLHYSFFSNHFQSYLNTMNTFPKHFTQWTLQAPQHISYPLVQTPLKPPKHTSCCHNFSTCSLSEYNDLNNTNNLKHCKIHILCVAVSSIFAQFIFLYKRKEKRMTPRTHKICNQICNIK